MQFNNPLPRTGMPSFHESSPLRSPRDSDATARLHYKNKIVARQTGQLVETVGKLARDLNKIKRKSAQEDISATTYFPFKILPSPAITEEADAEAVATQDGGTVDDGIDRTWRLFRVRAGAVGTADVANSDYAFSNPDDPSVNPSEDFEFFQDMGLDTATGIDFLVPDATVAFYVWIDCNDIENPFINAGTTRPGDGTDASFWAGVYILIAIIDTNTNSSSQEAIVRQYRRADVPIASGCNEIGDTVTLPV